MTFVLVLVLVLVLLLVAVLRGRKRPVLYVLLALLAVLFLFPFYWMLMSSLKSREGFAMTPPSFYPAQGVTCDVELPAGWWRVVEADGRRWLRLCASPDLLAGVRQEIK